MSIVTLILPTEAAVSLVEAVSGYLSVLARFAWNLGIFGILASLTIVFRPLIVGLLRTAKLIVQPRLTSQQRLLRRRWQGAELLNRLANQAEATQPNLAAEMRYLAARD